MDNLFNTAAFSQDLTPETFTNEVGHILSQPNSNGQMPPATQEKVVLTICNGTFCVDEVELCSFIFRVDHKETIIGSSSSVQTVVLQVRAICPNGNSSEGIILGDPEYFTLPTKAKDDMKLVSFNLGLEYMLLTFSCSCDGSCHLILPLLCEKMNASFLAERAKISKDGSYCDRRIDAYAWLLAAYNVIFCGYLSSIGLIDLESSRYEYERLYSYAITDLREQLREQLAKDPVYHFCKNIVSQRDRLIAASPLSTLDDNSLGFWKRDYYVLLTDAVDKVVDSRYPIDEDLLLTRIENEEILVPDPNRSRVSRHQHNSESKRVYKICRDMLIILTTKYTDWRRKISLPFSLRF